MIVRAWAIQHGRIIVLLSALLICINSLEDVTLVENMFYILLAFLRPSEK